MKTTIKLSIVALATLSTFAISGCSDKMDPTPHKLDVKKERYQSLEAKISVKKGQTFKNLVESLDNNQSDKVILDQTRTEIIFDKDLVDFTAKEILTYIKLNFNTEFSLRKYTSKLFVIEEKKDEKKERIILGNDDLIPEIKLETSGELTYNDLFNQLRSKGVNVFVNIENEDSFNLNKKLPAFKGNLAQFLRLTATQENLFVSASEEGVVLSDLMTKIYDLRLPKVKVQPALNATGTSGAISLTSTTGSSDTSSGTDAVNGITGGSGTATSGTDTTDGGATGTGADDEAGEVNPLADLDAAMEDMFGSDIKYNINESSGTMSVRGRSRELKSVGKLVKQFQDIYDKHIQIEMHVYEVALSDENAFGIDYSHVSSDLILSTGLTTAFDPSKGGSLKILDATDGKAQSAVFQFLNTFGRASVLTKPTLGTINNFPVKLNVLDSLDYVYKLSQEQTNTSTTGTQTNIATLDPEIQTVKTGFSLVLHPRIEDDYIKIAMKSVVSNLNELKEYSYGGQGAEGEANYTPPNILQLKDVSAREFEETVKIKEGEMVIVGGYQYTKKSFKKNGLPFTSAEDSALDAFTSAKASTEQRVEIVITLQAVVR